MHGYIEIGGYSGHINLLWSRIRKPGRGNCYGYIVLCVARPVTDCTIEVVVESHGKLYRNRFLDPLEPHEL